MPQIHVILWTGNRDAPRETGTSATHTFDSPERCAAWLIDQKLVFPGADDFYAQMIFQDETEALSAHRDKSVTSEADWRAVWELMTADAEWRCANYLDTGCTERTDDGEGYDGYCGNCADRLEKQGHWS